jgi:hypothetical protein
MSLFLNQLKTLLTTMSTVKEQESFTIGEWYTKDTSLECGYAACICGHQATAPPSPHFNLLPYPPRELYITAKVIAKTLEGACAELMGRTHLAEAIISGDLESRQYWAKGSGAFTEHELMHPHIKKEDPTIAEATSFIQLVISKVEAL